MASQAPQFLAKLARQISQAIEKQAKQAIQAIENTIRPLQTRKAKREQHE